MVQLEKYGLVNNDIKPDNMMLDKNNQLYMIDVDPIRVQKVAKKDLYCVFTPIYIPMITYNTNRGQ
jgi:serine/threonine protein kinase